MNIKRIIAFVLAAVMICSLAGCAAVKPAPESSDPVQTEQQQAPADEVSGEQQQTSKVTYLNAAGEALPLTVYNTGVVLPNPLTYSDRYMLAANAFASRMTEAIAAEQGSDWTGVYSPLSLQIALQILANGADEATEQALLSAVCGGIAKEDANICAAKLMSLFSGVRGVNMSNAVVVNKDYRINQSFANTAGGYYEAAVGALDFGDGDAAREALNGWISEHTEGLIDELIKETSRDTVMMILNTLYFDISWSEPFIVHRNLTEFNGTNSTEWVSMMQRAGEMKYGSFDEGEMAIVPYKNDDYAMAVILPQKGVTPAEAVSALIGEWTRCEDKSGMLTMPKVELDTDIDVLKLVSAMGLEDAVRGNYSKLLEGEFDAAVSQILQGAKINVNESGTTAAAATAIETNKSAPIANDFEMTCDRPYAMVIYNTVTGAVMFVSIVNNIG